MRPAASRTDSIHQSTNRPMMNSACPPRCPLHSLYDTPYLGPNDTRMSPNTFYGYSLIGNDGDESPMGRATTTCSWTAPAPIKSPTTTRSVAIVRAARDCFVSLGEVRHATHREKEPIMININPLANPDIDLNRLAKLTYSAVFSDVCDRLGHLNQTAEPGIVPLAGKGVVIVWARKPASRAAAGASLWCGN